MGCGHASGSGFCATGAQPASTMAASQARGAHSMWVVYLEMGLVLALAVFIVWWTWPKKRRDDDQ